MRNKDLRLVVDLYKYYYASICKIDNVIFKMTDNRLKMTLDFIQKCKDFNNTKVLGEDYIRSYMEFQFNHWYRHDGKYGKGASIQLEWIIGSKAWKRWISRTEKHKSKTSFIVNKDLKKNVKLKRFKFDEGFKLRILKLNDEEEEEKNLYFNSSKGFINCTLNTTLYNHKSKFCASCNFQTKCKDELKERFAKVYKIRGY